MGANSMNESTLTKTKLDTLGLDVGIVGPWRNTLILLGPVFLVLMWHGAIAPAVGMALPPALTVTMTAYVG